MDFKQTLADDLSNGILVVPGLVLGNVSARGSHNHTATTTRSKISYKIIEALNAMVRLLRKQTRKDNFYLKRKSVIYLFPKQVLQ